MKYKIDFSGPMLRPDGNPQKIFDANGIETNTDVELSDQFAAIMNTLEGLPALKIWGWATELAHGEILEMDETDYLALKEACGHAYAGEDADGKKDPRRNRYGNFLVAQIQARFALADLNAAKVEPAEGS